MAPFERHWTRADCGHLRSPELVDEDCPYCEDYADAFAQDVADALLDDMELVVVPHVRE